MSAKPPVLNSHHWGTAGVGFQGGGWAGCPGGGSRTDRRRRRVGTGRGRRADSRCRGSGSLELSCQSKKFLVGIKSALLASLLAVELIEAA